jgi:hypothetical protein
MVIVEFFFPHGSKKNHQLSGEDSTALHGLDEQHV